MACARVVLVFVAVLMAGNPKLTTAQEAVATNGRCGYCSVFQKFIAEASAQHDLNSLEKLQRDVQRMSSLSDADRKHIEKSIKDAIAKFKAERSAPNAFVRGSAVAPRSEMSSAVRVEESALVAEESVDSNDEPKEEDVFEFCQRVILFATTRGDSIAINNLEKRLVQFSTLTESQRNELKRMIRESRSSSDEMVLVEEASSFSLAELAPSADRIEAVVISEMVTDPATGDANLFLGLPAQAKDVFSSDYLRIRQRYLDFFFFGGMTATELDVNLTDGKLVLSKDTVTKASFADQTLHMGQAMLAFAGEANILRSKGISSPASEAAIEILLDAFDKLEAADAQIYGTSKTGFFVRDVVHKGDRMGVPDDWGLKSDMQEAMSPGGNKTRNAMSLDQATSLFVGWWAITKWSNNADNVSRAKKQIDRVMNFLMDSRFLIRLPNGGSIPNDRGPDFRYAAGFLCHVATQATGKVYFLNAKIDITIKGDPIRFRDDNLGEFEIPGYKIPANMPVALSHPAILALKPIGLVGLTAPPKIAIRISDLIPDANNDREIMLPCAHLGPAHPGGDTSNTLCPHLTAAHPGGDPGPPLPCTHVVKIHPNGDNTPCLHMTAKHPGGDDGPVLPCHHLKKQHDHDWIEKTVRYRCPTFSNPGRKCKKKIKTKVPCTHFVAKHPGCHPTKVPCVHLVPKHPGGDTVPCIHTKLAHPDGHATKVPCVHLVQAHPDGHDVTVPCVHIEQKHPSGHKFDLTKLDIEIPLGEKLHSYSRHIALQCLAFEPTVNGPIEFMPAALNSNHSWSGLLRLHARGDVPSVLVVPKAESDLGEMDDQNGPSSLTPIPWAKTNRWERCTDLQPGDGGPTAHNGLDFLSLEVLARLAH